MPAITRDGFRKPAKLKVEKFPLPEFGDDAYVNLRALSAKDLIRLQKQYGEKADTGNLAFAYDLLSSCIVDDGGTSLFLDAADAEHGLEVSLPTLQELVQACLATSGIDTTEKN